MLNATHSVAADLIATIKAATAAIDALAQQDLNAALNDLRQAATAARQRMNKAADDARMVVAFLSGDVRSIAEVLSTDLGAPAPILTPKPTPKPTPPAEEPATLPPVPEMPTPQPSTTAAADETTVVAVAACGPCITLASPIASVNPIPQQPAPPAAALEVVAPATGKAPPRKPKRR